MGKGIVVIGHSPPDGRSRMCAHKPSRQKLYVELEKVGQRCASEMLC